MGQISKRLSVEGPDHEGEYEIVLADDGCDPSYCHYITRAEADALIMALARPGDIDAALNGIVRCVVDEAGRIIAPPQPEPAPRPPGAWDSNHDARRPIARDGTTGE